MKVKDSEKRSKFETECMDTERKMICRFQFELLKGYNMNDPVSHVWTRQN